MEFFVGLLLFFVLFVDFILKSSGVNFLICFVVWFGFVGEGLVFIEGCLFLVCFVVWFGFRGEGLVFMEGSLCFSGRGLVSLVIFGVRVFCRIIVI